MIKRKMTRRCALALFSTPAWRRRRALPELAGSDRATFVGWFSWLAEALFEMLPAAIPHEVRDCSALLRFAYREALRPHTAEWARELGLPGMPMLGELRRPVSEPDVFLTESGARRQFADAEHLMRFNTWPVSRSMAAAAHGDLLFYRQLGESQSWHSMVYLRRSAFETDRQPRLVYHTGPLHGRVGEVRRPTLDELRAHPDARWRPLVGNPNFLGLFRWNILGRTD
jgi:uncharacterized protein YfaT (DUF1175 family)